MTAFSEFLHTDGNGRETSAVYNATRGQWELPSSFGDGADVALGATTDSAETDSTATATLVAIVKGILSLLADYFAAPSTASSPALEKQLVVKASAGTLYQVRAYHDGGAPAWIQIHDRNVAATNTQKPVISQPIAASGGYVVFDFGRHGRDFATGIVVSLSDVGDGWSDPAGDHARFDVIYS